jgi:hypothetical protein
MGVGGQRHAPAALPPGKIAGVNLTEGWVGCRVGLNGGGNLAPNGIRCPDVPARKRVAVPGRLCYTYCKKLYNLGG